MRPHPIRRLHPDAPMCTSGKRPYRTEEEALEVLRETRRSRRLRDPSAGRVPGSLERGVYRCGYCHWHHVYSQKFHSRRSNHAYREQKRRG